MPTALVVEDDPATLVMMASLLERRGFITRTAASLAEARQNLDPLPDICMLDLELPDGKGTELLAEELTRHTDVVLITGYGSVETSVEAMRRGAKDYLTKPLRREALDRILARFATINEQPRSKGVLVGQSPEMSRLLRTIDRVGPTDATVLIVGESGTGKELVAARIHERSRRSRGRYLALNCGAVSPNLIESELFGHEKGSFTGAIRQHAGYFERAHGGTLFLDEITEMPLDLQVRLLRVLESRHVSRVGSPEAIPVNVRVIAATNRDPREAVRQRKLREDLLYRLQVVPVEIPPLRGRSGDIRVLAQHFLADLNQALGEEKVFAETVLNRFEQHSWPGNVRELLNAVQRAFILTEGRVITHPGLLTSQLSANGESGDSVIQVRFGDSLAAVEQRVIQYTVQHCRTQDEAARTLGVSAKTLYNKLRLYEAQARAREADELFPEPSSNAFRRPRLDA